jgi:hypothetical protein
MSGPALVWLLDDLRLDDQPAIASAADRPALVGRAGAGGRRDQANLPAAIVDHSFARRARLSALVRGALAVRRK